MPASAPHWYFHRPLHELFGAFFRAGFVLDGLEEPALVTQNQNPHEPSWSNLPGIPPILAARFVPRPKESDFGAGTARSVVLRKQLSAPRTRAIPSR